ncbi:hypothetical protein FVA95_13525 [Pseudonocardia sp. EV170527-09]|uniref:hypothetical protein n=1 Tax=Pseudonocardia sp. EV170527-09 TaxID=2603411 RepID=UPI0011F254C8|nr:hypothetical protein [Pseudonocardia sp. EV170527-09]KAA1027857.1 hypothetical protein FVA95_13525 [Pseudonocardia sp. EV170527-09]
MNADFPRQQWSSDAAVSYEAAQEAINEVLACYVALLEREGQKPEPDRERISHLRGRIADCTHQQRSLSPKYPGDLAAVRGSYSRRLVELREELG